MIGRTFGIDLDCTVDRGNRLVHVSRGGERHPEDVVGVRISGLRGKDLAADALGLRVIGHSVELAGHFDRLERRHVDLAVLRLRDPVIDGAAALL